MSKFNLTDEEMERFDVDLAIAQTEEAWAAEEEMLAAEFLGQVPCPACEGDGCKLCHYSGIVVL